MERLTKKAKMNVAIQAKKRNPKLNYTKLNYTKLSSIYKVPYFTLIHHFNNKYARTDIIPPLQKLTLTEKKSIIDHILNLNSQAFFVRR